MPSRGQGRGRKTGNGQRSSSSTSQSGCKMVLDVRESNQAKLNTFIKTQPHLSHVNDILSIFKEITPTKLKGKEITINTDKVLLNWVPESVHIPNEGTLTFQEGDQIKEVKAYQKMIPLQYPYNWMKNKDCPMEPFSWNLQKSIVLAPENQGYIDTIASALTSKLRNQISTPHFCEFYGGFRAVADVYRYNLEDDIEEFRFSKWFWESLDNGVFNLCIIEKETDHRLTNEEINHFLRPDSDFLQDDSSDSEFDSDEDDSDKDDSDSGSVLNAETLEDFLPENQSSMVYSLQEANTDNFVESNDSVSIQILKRSGTPKTIDTISTNSSDSNMSFTNDFLVYAEFKSMPVTILYLEKLSGTMDSLLESSEFTPANTPEREVMWSAWFFQVCAALSQLQSLLNLTHNDLHTNNILWKKTEEQYLWYKDSNERVWRVPTFGYIFSIIDYGRAIFTVNGHCCISSDYDDGHDASGMYNFGPIEDKDYPRVLPNKSFDLCRLACSFLRALFPKNPESKPKGQILTKEDSWEVRETNSALFNAVWTWLKMKDGGNVLETQSGKERFPGFELYSIIASQVRDAVPSLQFNKPVFQQFLWTGIPVNNIKYIPVYI